MGVYVLLVGLSPPCGIVVFFSVCFYFVGCCCSKSGVVDSDLVVWCVFGIDLVLFALDLAFLFYGL